MSIIDGSLRILSLTLNHDLFQQRKRLIVRRLEQCKGKHDLPMVFHNLTLLRDPKTEEVTFDFDVTVRKPVSMNFAVRIMYYVAMDFFVKKNNRRLRFMYKMLCL